MAAHDDDPGAMASGQMAYPMPRPPSLTVEQMCALAQAGVKFELKDVNVLYAPPPQTPTRAAHLLEPLFHRLTRNGTLPNALHTLGNEERSDFSASEWNGKVYVFYADRRGEPIILEDDATLYPSDALIAKIVLIKESRPRRFDAGHAQQDVTANKSSRVMNTRIGPMPVAGAPPPALTINPLKTLNDYAQTLPPAQRNAIIKKLFEAITQ